MLYWVVSRLYAKLYRVVCQLYVKKRKLHSGCIPKRGNCMEKWGKDGKASVIMEG